MNKKLLIFTHGNLASELREVAGLVIGKAKCECVTALSNSGLSMKEAFELLEGNINESDNFIIMTDFPGGSCFISSKKISSANENIFTISGVNISMVLSFITKKDNYDIIELLEVIKKDAHRSVI